MTIGRARTAAAGFPFKSRNAATGAAARVVAFVVVAAVAVLAEVDAAAADIYVMESSVPGMRAGVRLADNESLTLPAGTYVRAVLPSGKTQTIRGPFSGKVADLTKGVESNESLMVPVRKILATGGATETTAGGTRSVARVARPRGFSLVEIPSWVNGTVCLLKGGNAVLVRQSTAGAERAMLVDAKTFERAQVTWEAGSAAAAWPANLKLLPDATYQVLMQDREGRDVTVRFLDKAPADDDMLVELHKLGCVQQLETWLRERMAKKS
jgi:hypothetical protein